MGARSERAVDGERLEREGGDPYGLNREQVFDWLAESGRELLDGTEGDIDARHACLLQLRYPEPRPCTVLHGVGRRADRPRAHREVRKVVTVVFADVTGSTHLGEQLDPESLCAIMGRWFEAMRVVLERNGGTGEKLIGDALSTPGQ